MSGMIHQKKKKKRTMDESPNPGMLDDANLFIFEQIFYLIIDFVMRTGR